MAKRVQKSIRLTQEERELILDRRESRRRLAEELKRREPYGSCPVIPMTRTEMDRVARKLIHGTILELFSPLEPRPIYGMVMGMNPPRRPGIPEVRSEWNRLVLARMRPRVEVSSSSSVTELSITYWPGTMQPALFSPEPHFDKIRVRGYVRPGQIVPLDEKQLARLATEGR